MNNNCNVQVRGYKYSTKKDQIWFFFLQHLDTLLHIFKEPLKCFSGSLVFKALHDSCSYIRAKAVVKHHLGPQLCKAPTPFSSSPAGEIPQAGILGAVLPVCSRAGAGTCPCVRAQPMMGTAAQGTSCAWGKAPPALFTAKHCRLKICN